MQVKKHNPPIILKRLYRILVIACATLSLAVLWGQTQGQTISSFFNGFPLRVMFYGAISLLLSSVAFIKSFGKLAIAGILVALWCLFVWLLPTI